MSELFPRTNVGGVLMPRLIIGCNWISGFSHRSPAQDGAIKHRHNSPDSVADIFETFIREGVDACMGLFSVDSHLYPAVQEAQMRTGKELIIIDEPILNVDDNAAARREAEAEIKKSAQRGAKFCLPLHSCVEQLINKNTRTMNRLPDYLKMIRDAGMIPGLSAHMPEVIQYADLNEYDVETYIQIFNCMGFLMQVEIESVAKVIHNAKHPVITIKPCAAGRTTPYVGLNFSYNAIRPIDMVCIGAYDPWEAREDVEFARAAIERRLPDIESRKSPLMTEAVTGKIR